MPLIAVAMASWPKTTTSCNYIIPKRYLWLRQTAKVLQNIREFQTDLRLVESVMSEFLDGPFADTHAAASVYFLYKDLLDREPPNADVFAEAIAKYPRDLV